VDPPSTDVKQFFFVGGSKGGPIAGVHLGIGLCGKTGTLKEGRRKNVSLRKFTLIIYIAGPAIEVSHLMALQSKGSDLAARAQVPTHDLEMVVMDFQKTMTRFVGSLAYNLLIGARHAANLNAGVIRYVFGHRRIRVIL
jgi:hypothetical protein